MGKAIRFDKFRPSSEKASNIASRIRSSNTKAERLLRSTIWKMGFRFRKNVRDLPGKPDIVFPRERVVVFCDGDFWHGRNWADKKHKLQKGSNPSYWVAKIQMNMERDRKNEKQLEESGYCVLRFWESDIASDPDQAARRIAEIVLDRRLAYLSK